jgi:Uma2 family endonuclease
MDPKAGRTLMTVKEFHAWSRQADYEDKHVELVRGRPVVKDLPDPKHGFVCARLGYHLGGWCDRSRKHYACLGVGFIVERDPDTVYAPDVAVYSGTPRLEELPDEWTDHAPRFIVEVRQCGEEMEYLLTKVADYHRIGIAEVWIADPMAYTFGVHRRGERPTIRAGGEELASDDVLPGFRCNVADIFRLPGDKR